MAKRVNFTLPAIPLRGMIVFPDMTIQLDVGRDESIKSVEKALEKDHKIFLITQKDELLDKPEKEDLYSVGCICEIVQMITLPNENIRIIVRGDERASIKTFGVEEDCYTSDIRVQGQTYSGDDLECEAHLRALKKAFDEYVKAGGPMPKEAAQSLQGVEDGAALADLLAVHVLHRMEDKAQILALFDVEERMDTLTGILIRETELVGISAKIQQRVREQVEKNQKEYYLREQIHAIQEELGDSDAAEVNKLRERAEKIPLNEEAKEKVLKEISRLSRIPSGTPEAGVSSTYIDWILDLPWGITSEDNLDLDHARQVLDEDHDGMEKVKERIVEFLAVSRMRGDLRGPILCLVGPPGVGKTSIAKSVARALGRKFVQMSLGGVRDEAEIRGHRRTYIGAIPGRVIYGIKQAGTMNPVFLFDEIDKMTHDFHGDPASAMLEVLDSEQNHAFRDHYLELPFDLSKVLFLLTANNEAEIPAPLADRMEIIRLSGYTDVEKLEIAKNHLVPKQLEANGLKAEQVVMTDEALRFTIEGYTREAGVRQLEREIAAQMRKSVCRILDNQAVSLQITEKEVPELLGKVRYHRDAFSREPAVGIAMGLAYTTVGGEMLAVETTTMPGTGLLELTGQLGDVMKESAKAAMSYVRAHGRQLGLEDDFRKKVDVHIHVPEGAVPKDGPSAGVTLTTSLVSAFTGIPVRQDVAMTGEISLSGRVMPVGGIKEKVLGAYRMGIREILLPKDNTPDLDELPAEAREKMTFHPMENIGQVLEHALVRCPAAL